MQRGDGETGDLGSRYRETRLERDASGQIMRTAKWKKTTELSRRGQTRARDVASMRIRRDKSVVTKERRGTRRNCKGARTEHVRDR